MNVKVKKGECQSMIPGIVVSLIFLGAGIGIVFLFISTMENNFTLDQFMVKFQDKGIMVLAGVFFAGIALFLLSYLIRSPKKYKALLVTKRLDEYKGQNITYMVFQIEKPEKKVANLKTEYQCYTIGANKFYEGNYYAVGIKEFNWQITRVEAWDGSNVCDRMGTVSFLPVIMAFAVIFGGTALFSVINFVYQIIRHESFSAVSIIAFVFCGLILWYFLRITRQWNKDNTIKQRIVTGRGTEIGRESLPQNMTTPDFFSIENEKNPVTFFVEHNVYDGNRNIVLQVVSDPLMLNTRMIKDAEGNVIAQLESEILGTSDTYTITMNGDVPFIVRKKVVMGIAYEVQGLDFEIYGNQNGTEYIIYNLQGERVAVISKRSITGNIGWVGDMDVQIMEGFDNNIYIMLIAICVVKGYLAWENRRF